LIHIYITNTTATGGLALSSNNRFLLVKAWGCGFWSDVSHVLGQLLFAEIMDRIPVIYWGADSLYGYGEPGGPDAFTMYFLPISNYSINDLLNQNYTYYPLTWNRNNLLLEAKKQYPKITDFLRRPENVLVNNHHIHVQSLLPYINNNHPLYGCSRHNIDLIYCYLIHKYLKLQPYISDEIEDYYSTNMKNTPILAVHIRGGDKSTEVPNLHEINNFYPQEINNHLINHPETSIFLLTDQDSILTEYKNSYGNKLIYTECCRTNSDPVLCQKRNGIEIIKDTCLAAKCDYFIGNAYSNVSQMISLLKIWPAETIKLLYLKKAPLTFT
jgi:hypothetical protein